MYELMVLSFIAFVACAYVFALLCSEVLVFRVSGGLYWWRDSGVTEIAWHDNNLRVSLHDIISICTHYMGLKPHCDYHQAQS